MSERLLGAELPSGLKPPHCPTHLSRYCINVGALWQHTGLQLLLSLPQAEGTDTFLRCCTSAVVQALSSSLPLILNPRPCASRGFHSHQRHGVDSSWQHKHKMRCPQGEKITCFPRQERNWAGLCSPDRRGLCCPWCLCSPCASVEEVKLISRQDKVLLRKCMTMDMVWFR